MADPAPTPRSNPLVRGCVPRGLVAVVLTVILAGAALLRLPGITYGIPYIYEWDEPTVMNSVIGMLQRGDWSPHAYIYPPLYLYLQLIVAKLHTWSLHSAGLMSSPASVSFSPPDRTGYYWYLSIPTFYIWGRALTLLFGAGCVYLVYLIGRKAFGTAAGLLAAVMLATAPGAVYYSGTLRTDVPMTFMVLLTFLVGLQILHEGKRHHYFLAGILAGLAIATKYSAWPIIAPLLTAHALAPGRRRLLDWNAAVLCGGGVLGVIAGFPELVLRTRPVVLELISDRFFRPGVPLGTLIPYFQYLAVGINWFWFIPSHAGIGLLPVACAIRGAAGGWIRDQRALILVLSFAVPYLAITSTQSYVSPQYMAPLIPFLAVLAARGLMIISAYLGVTTRARVPRSAIASLGIIAVVGGPVWESTHLALALRTPDSRVVATGWLTAHVPARSTIAIAEDLHWFLPALERAPLRILVATRAQETTGWLIEHHIDYYVVPGARNPFPRLPRLAAFPGNPRSAPPPDSPPNAAPIIAPAIVVVDARRALPVETVTRFIRRVASTEMVAEPVTSPATGTILSMIRLPGLRVAPGRYKLSLTGNWPTPSWLPPLAQSRYTIRVIAGDRTLGTFMANTSVPMTFTTAPIDVRNPQVLSVRLIEELQGSVWGLRPTKDQCARVPDPPGDRGFRLPNRTQDPRQFTIEAWILLHTLHRPSAVNEERETRILSKNAEQGYTLRIEGQPPERSWKLELALAGKWSVVTGSAGVASTGTEGVVPVEEWVHVAATADGHVARLYMNGEPVGTTFTQNPTGGYDGEVRSTGAPLLIGCRAIFDDWFDGILTHVRIWDHARTPEAIRHGMSAPPAAGAPGLVAAWSFDTATPDGAIPDLSGRGHDIPDAAALRVLTPVTIGKTQRTRAALGLPTPGEIVIRRVP